MSSRGFVISLLADALHSKLTEIFLLKPPRINFKKVLGNLLLLCILITSSISKYSLGVTTNNIPQYLIENQVKPSGLPFYDKILFVSKKIAANLISNAIAEGDGYKWPIHFRRTYFNPGFHSGAAGVGAFFLSLYLATGNITYLKYAEGAANWIISIAEKKTGDAVTWCSYDDEKCWYLTPDKDVSGIIKFLLQLYNTTKNDLYLNYAERGAKWIINSALMRDRVGAYALYNPPRQAAFGVYSYVQRDVGTLMIELYVVTKDIKYLEVAKSIGDWIVSTSECDQYLCRWYDDRGYVNAYCIEGMSSIADLLYELFRVTNDRNYLNVAEKLTNWIESQGKIVDRYRIKFPDYRGRYMTVINGYWDRPFFPMTPADIFVKSYLYTRNTTRLDIAKHYANWLISISRIEGDQARVPFLEGQEVYHAWINARVFNFIIALYGQTRESMYLDFAAKLLNYILSTAVEDSGFVWPRLDGKIWITFGLGEGSCAIGYYLLSACYYLQSTSYESFLVNVISSYGTPSGSGYYKPGSVVTISVSPIIDHGNGTRRVFQGWYQDGVLLNHDPQFSLVVEKPVTIQAAWRTEYYVSVKSPYGTAKGEGWYASGATAVISIDVTTIDHGNGTRRVFKGWYEGDSPLSGEQSLSVTMDKPKIITGVWDTEYEVKVLNVRGVATGSGWYKCGETATVSIFLIRIEEPFVTHVFEFWKTDREIFSSSPTYTFIVDRPVTLVASWRTELKTVNIVLSIMIPIVISLVLTIALYLRKEKIRPRKDEIIDEEMKKIKDALRKLEDET